MQHFEFEACCRYFCRVKPIVYQSSSNVETSNRGGYRKRKVREARLALILGYLYPRGSNTLNTSGIGEACPVSCAYTSSFGLQLPRSCSTCSSSPGQVVGVVKQSPPPRRRPRFGRGTRSTNRNRIFYEREEYGRGGWKVQHEARRKGKGVRDEKVGVEHRRWSIYIYICTYRTGLHARISKILAKIRSSIRRVCMLWQVLDRVMTRRFFFFFREIRGGDTTSLRLRLSLSVSWICSWDYVYVYAL